MAMRVVVKGWILFLLACAAPAAGAQIDAEAIPGQPFGVGRVTITAPAGDITAALESGGLSLVDEEGRVFYPAFTTGRIGALIGQLLGAADDAPPNAVTALFLFKGQAPLHLTFYAPRANAVTVAPAIPRRRGRQAHGRLLARWWREYNAAAGAQEADGDYPPLVETYLTTMLGERLGLQPPLISRIQQSQTSEKSQLKQTLDLLGGVEALRTETMRNTLLGRGSLGQFADRPIPADIAWPRFEPLAETDADDVEIEPIALHVPQECFYVRFGRFSNYLWLDQLMEDFGGELGSMITLRGHNANLSGRMRRQLALKKSALAELVGDAVIADVAIIGRDTYLREGAAIGMLFQARSEALKHQFTQDRAVALKEFQRDGATLETVEIGGREVTLLATPDNKIRSFYAVDGRFHLHTTSRAMVERFFEAGAGKAPLGASTDFRHARRLMPLERDDTIFAYLSPAFFRGLVSPQYQIELARRLESVTDMELIQLARLTARAEGQPADTIEDLVDGRYLPSGFGRRADGSGPIIEPTRIVDSRRGARGSFIPIPDVDLRAATLDEETRYAARAAYYQQTWQRMDPLMFGVKRYALHGEGLERIVIDAHVSPFENSKYGWIISMLGPPTTHRVSAAPGDIVSLQASLRGGLLDPNMPPHQVFLGIQDEAPLTDLRPTSFLQTLQILRAAPAYLGAWPKPGFLDMLPLGLGGGEPDALGYSQLPFGLWRRQWDEFSAMSFDRGILDRVAPALGVAPTDDPAQIRLHVGDVSQSQLRGWVNSMNYDRARQASLGNARLMHAVSEQLRTPREEAFAAAESLLDAKLECPLGGEYELSAEDGAPGMWRSTAWPAPGEYGPPPEYQAPLLEWFRGLDAGLTMYGDHLVVHAELDMQRSDAAPPRFALPLFELFGGDKSSPAKKPPAEEIKTPSKSRDKPREF